MSEIVSIPDSAIDGSEYLSKIAENQYLKLLKGIKSAKPYLARNEFTKNVVRLSGCDPTDADRVISLVTQMFSGCYVVNLTRDEFLVEFFDELKQQTKKVFTKNQFEIIKKRLKELFSIENPLAIVGKAQVLMAEHEHLFRDARITTDLRPIFTTDINESPKVAMLVHKLHINHYSGDEQNANSFFVLDSEDLRILKKAIDRAIKKEKTLNDFAKNSKFDLLVRDYSDEDKV